MCDVILAWVKAVIGSRLARAVFLQSWAVDAGISRLVILKERFVRFTRTAENGLLLLWGCSSLQ